MNKSVLCSRFVSASNNLLDKGRASSHPFLKHFREDYFDFEDLHFFAVQWHLTARAHRLSFPWLIAAIEDETVRFDLVCILHEEYGEGDRKKLHVDLLAQFLATFGETKASVLDIEPIPPVATFHSELRKTWQTGDARAFGLQYGLECLAREMQICFAEGLLKYNYISSESRQYFDIHAEAEKRHVSVTENGLDYYLHQDNGYDQLLSGVVLADNLLTDIWDAMLEQMSPIASKNDIGNSFIAEVSIA